MEYITSYKLSSIDDLIKKVEACETLNLDYELGGTLKEFTYDLIDGKIFGAFAGISEKIDYLKRNHQFSESDTTFRKITANDDPSLPKEDFLELHVIEWRERFFVLDQTFLDIFKK